MTGLPWNTVWIIGASSGIGRAVALRLANSGVHVAASARHAAPLEEVASSANGPVSIHLLDVTDGDVVERTAREIEAAHGPVDLALVCSGTWKPFDIDDIDPQAFQDTIAVNYMGPVHVAAALVPSMRIRGTGQIAFVASVAGYFGLPKAASYGSSKAGLINLAQSLRTELDGSGVTISLVDPGFVATPMTETNAFPMPFLMEPERAAERLVAGLSTGRFEVTFPRRLAWPMKVIDLLPYPVFFWLIRKFVARR